jgi:hypothetical protein
MFSTSGKPFNSYQLNLMTTEILKNKTARYLCGMAIPSEKNQIQTWLSCTDNTSEMLSEERDRIEDDITAQVMAYVESTLVYQTKTDRWWKKITASF